jgi:hypothetical protein
MAEKYKSVLEKYNEDKKPRLPTAEEEAIEPVYPEEYLIGGPGKAVASGFIGSGKKAAKEASRYRIAQTRIGERAPDMEAVKDSLHAREQIKNYLGDGELSKIAKQEARQALKKGALNKAESSTERGMQDFFGEVGNTIGGRMYEQRQNAAGDTYKKGGKVKSTASSRGDGVAQRGKTKGRIR